ncbi:cell division protein FtsZ [uncultured Rikenella sp.]|uniref:cell division protein FtsZ n=1 Tax=uncultured Rikenella sp. TaxID=368003 RepID=UPI0026153FE9|nr:cell division protein FtsZ [uncultured Rikenella sp.]
MVEFVDIAPVSSSIIMVVGVGGGGSNAVNHMYKLGITDVSFMVCNTDRQALERSPIPTKIRLGETLTEGLGAGNNPERGRAAAEESIEDIKEVFREKNIKMVFVTAGMGGGTGTGAAPVIAEAAKTMGILTVAIVTLPFMTEGPRRIRQALEGIERIRHNVDALLVVNNENINEIYGDLTLSEAFGKADDILASAAKSISDIIMQENRINVDFADVRTIMADSGIALMGSAQGCGENRAREVTEAAMSSPLLNHRDIAGAKNVLLTITSGTKEVKMTETRAITQFVQDRTGFELGTDLIWGAGTDETLGDDIRITIIATGFDIDIISMVREQYAEIVDKDPKRKTYAGKAGGAEAAAPKRETISLVDLDSNAGKKKPKTVSDGTEDFAVVTHQTERTDDFSGRGGYGEPAVHGYGQPVESAPAAEPVTQIVQMEAEEEDFKAAEALFSEKEANEPSRIQEKAEASEHHEIRSEEAALSVAPVTELSDDELENIPAYIRRRMKIEAEALPAGSKVSRETLKNDSAGRQRGDGHLFD